MVVQLILGSALIIVSALVAALCWWALEIFLLRAHGWVISPPHGPKLTINLSLAMVWSIVMMTTAVWIWAIAFLLLDLFVTLEEAIYFSLVAFTTLGFGDVLLPVEWRLLSGLAAANGLLVFGLLTAMLVETLRQTRQRQRRRIRFH